jgi:hypothetical protein
MSANKWNVYISSKQRVKGDVNDFWIKLDKPILLSSDKTRFEVYVNDLEYPYSFYTVNANNNTFNARLTNGVSTIDQVITITEGNYTILTLLDAIRIALNNAYLADMGFVGTYSKATGRVTFTFDSPFYPGWNLILYLTDTITGEMTGFETTTFVSTIAETGTKNVNVHPISSFLLRSNTLISSNQDSESLSTKNTSTDILFKVPINVSPGQYIYANQNPQNRVFLNTEIIDMMRFYVTSNRSSLPVNNHGLDISFTLTILEVIRPEIIIDPKLEQLGMQVDKVDLQQQREELLKQLEVLKKNLQDSNEETS